MRSIFLLKSGLPLMQQVLLICRNHGVITTRRFETSLRKHGVKTMSQRKSHDRGNCNQSEWLLQYSTMNVSTGSQEFEGYYSLS